MAFSHEEMLLRVPFNRREYRVIESRHRNEKSCYLRRSLSLASFFALLHARGKLVNLQTNGRDGERTKLLYTHTAAFIVINYDREETNDRGINKCDFLFSRLPSGAVHVLHRRGN